LGANRQPVLFLFMLRHLENDNKKIKKQKIKVKNKKQITQIIRWFARILGSLSLAFLLFMVGAHVLATITGEGETIGKFNSVSEMISFAFFPVSIIIGLGIAWKWEGLGGFITIAGIIGFHLIRPDLIFDLIINGLAAPGLLFIIYWFLVKGLNTKKLKQ